MSQSQLFFSNCTYIFTYHLQKCGTIQATDITDVSVIWETLSKSISLSACLSVYLLVQYIYCIYLPIHTILFTSNSNMIFNIFYLQETHSLVHSCKHKAPTARKQQADRTKILGCWYVENCVHVKSDGEWGSGKSTGFIWRGRTSSCHFYTPDTPPVAGKQTES